MIRFVSFCCVPVLVCAIGALGGGLALADCGALYALAQQHANDMARRNSLDHDGFRARIAPLVKSAAAENVAWGCATADCVYRVWAKSSGHRDNMLMRAITHYGLASAAARNGRRYWALELGN